MKSGVARYTRLAPRTFQFGKKLHLIMCGTPMPVVVNAMRLSVTSSSLMTTFSRSTARAFAGTSSPLFSAARY